MPNRRLKLFIILGILAVVMIAGCAMWLWGRRPLPQIQEISEMKATYYEDKGDKKVQFSVPEEHWEKIFDALLPARLDPLPAGWVVLGQLDITLKNGRPFVVML